MLFDYSRVNSLDDHSLGRISISNCPGQVPDRTRFPRVDRRSTCRDFDDNSYLSDKRQNGRKDRKQDRDTILIIIESVITREIHFCTLKARAQQRRHDCLLADEPKRLEPTTRSSQRSQRSPSYRTVKFLIAAHGKIRNAGNFCQRLIAQVYVCIYMFAISYQN